MAAICSSLLSPRLPSRLNPRQSPSIPKPSYSITTHTLCARRRTLPSPTVACYAAMEVKESSGGEGESSQAGMKLLFVEMGVGYDQHGQDITAAAMRACRDAIASNSIPAFRRGSIPGANSDQMKLQVKLGVPRLVQHLLDVERVKSVFPYGKILDVEVMDGGMICSSGVCLEAMGDKNDDCYVVNAAVYVGY